MSISGKAEISTKYGQRTFIKQVNQYKLLFVLGEGSYAKVYLGQDTITNQYYAIKRIKLKSLARTSSGISQLEHEIQTMRQLSHPHILSLHEVIHLVEDSLAYIVIQYADAGSLSSLLEDGINFSPVEVRYIFKQIAEGIKYLHENGIVHQDIKPSNILLQSNGNALISDFGIGHSFQSAAMVVGTPAYQAPEVIDESFADEECDPGGEDIWSLGVTLYELCFGELPFGGGNVFEIVRNIAYSTLEPPPDCDPELWDLIKNMLEVEAAHRFKIDQVLSHPYLQNVQKIDIPKLKAIDIPEEDLPIVKVTGKVCEKGYKFAIADQSLTAKLRSFHAPFKSA